MFISLSAGKEIIIIFCDIQGIILNHFVPLKTTVTEHYYTTVIKSELLSAIKRKRLQLQRSEILLHIDNAPSHNGHVVLSIYLSIFTGSLIYEHYTRECEFGNFDKIKNKKTQKTTQKKHKNFWLNFCLNKECPKLLCGLGICHRRRQTIPMWNSTGEKRILQGITVCLVSAVLSTM